MMYTWSKLSSSKWRDAWEERFQTLEDTNLVITEFPNKTTVRVELYCKTKKRAEEVKKEFGGTVKKLVNRDWVAMSAPEIPPIKIREKFLITTEENDAELEKLTAEIPGRAVISIPAKMAFGTGDHATTSTCLRFLCDLHAQDDLPENFSCLDVGCGTGILAIAAHKLGAKPIAGMDYDPAAVRISKENAKNNGVPPRGVKFSEVDVLNWTPDRAYDLVFANVFSDVLQAAFPTFKKAVAPKGHLIISGILEDHWPDTRDAGDEAGFYFREVRQRGKWVTALAGHAGG